MFTNWIKFILRPLKRSIISLIYYGDKRYCPICERHSRKFNSAGINRRYDAMCPRCGAFERHRFVWLYFKSNTNLFDGKLKKVLHVAPEGCIEPRLREQLGKNYFTADLFDARAMMKMDITDIQFPDESFDVIYCSHVLEHVTNDRQAMREFYRILKNDGWAILLVPITADKTIEDPSIVDPQERLKVFGQEDHLRRYGSDYINRLREAGFKVTTSEYSDMFENSEALKMGLNNECGTMFFCRK